MPDADIERIVASKIEWIKAVLKKTEEQKSAAPELTADEIKSLARQAAAALPGRVRYFADIIGVSYGRITIRNQTSRWGSCSSKGNLNFNCLLMLLPAEITDYVIVHELCHRRQMNHSRDFWNEVGRVLPDYREREAWLKKNGGAVIGRMPRA